jgi:hypothetical protein
MNRNSGTDHSRRLLCGSTDTCLPKVCVNILIIPFSLSNFKVFVLKELTHKKSPDISFLFLPCETRAIPASYDWYTVTVII